MGLDILDEDYDEVHAGPFDTIYISINDDKYLQTSCFSKVTVVQSFGMGS